MAWKKINNNVVMWETPVLGTEDQKDGKRFMALCIDPSSNKPYKGIARQVTQRKGNVDEMGFVDMSKLVLIESKNLLKWNVIKDLQMKGIQKIIKNLECNETFFIGLEDPDIFIDEAKDKHVYFTIAFKYKNKEGHRLYLGHAVGDSLDNLTATNPVISNNKEIAISPIKNKKMRYVLAESWTENPEEGISLLKAENMNKNWKFDKLVFDPKKHSFPWCKGYASPCRILDLELVNINNSLLLGICTGNSGEYTKDGKEFRGNFEPGLFLFDYKTGEMPWIAKNSLFKDPKAATITFASEVVPINKNEVILFAHPNDSFVRAYKLNLIKLKQLLPDI